MFKRITKKSIALLMVIITILSNIANITLATEISSAYIKNGGSCGHHLQYYNTDRGEWSYINTTYAYYEENGVAYPAYCLNRELPGVESGEYVVNVNQVMDDVRIWRVAVNGYPYQSPSAMAVENELDAFVATKQAIYCILYDWDPVARYRGADSRGTAITNAIINLVNIGRYGNQTPANAEVTTNKIGEFVEDGEYYSQEYSINSLVETSKYTITATNGLPTGSQITNVYNNSQTTFEGNEHFKVRVPKNQIAGDINAIIALQAKSKTYPVFYGETSIPGNQNYLLTFDPYGDASGIATLNLKTDTGKIKIVKKDAETDVPIAGVTFQLSTKDGNIISNSTTNADGIATFTNLYQSEYILKEIATGNDYILSDKSFNITVEYNKTASITITNEHKKGNVKIYKRDADNNMIMLGNVEFKLYSEELKKVIGTYYTDENGELKIEGLRTGNYKLIETKTNKWYNLAEDTEIEVEWDKETVKDIENELKKGQVKVIKVDKENNQIKLAGVQFEVLNECNKVLEKITTDENGEALTANYPIRDFNKLKIRETKTLENYALNKEAKTIILKENQIENVIFENEKIKGYLEITKVDSKTKEPLEGATFGIYDMEDNEIAQITTNEEGKATSELIPYGKYYAKELSTGSVYYLLNENSFEFEIKENHEIVKKTIDNEPTDIKVDVDKEGTVEIRPGEKVNYNFSNIANNSNVYLENFKWYDFIPTDYIRLEKMTTGTWNQDLTYDVYYKTNKSDDYILFKEDLKTTENYDLDFTKIDFTEDEYIVETCFDFGKVETGFREDIKPTMQCISFDTLEDGQTFTNHTKTVGIYFGITAEANSDWSTIVHKEKEPEIILPRTGK